MSYCLVDAARMEVEFSRAKEMAGVDNLRCLYKGASEMRLSNVAPYLFVANPPSFVDWLFDEGWGNAWFVFVLSSVMPSALHNHFRRFLIVHNQAGKALYFRFYDPRVLRQFLPNCTSAELIDFFGPVRYFLMEDSDPAYSISFWLEQGALKSARHLKAEAHRNYKTYLMRKQ